MDNLIHVGMLDEMIEIDGHENALHDGDGMLDTDFLGPVDGWQSMVDDLSTVMTQPGDAPVYRPTFAECIEEIRNQRTEHEQALNELEIRRNRTEPLGMYDLSFYQSNEFHGWEHENATNKQMLAAEYQELTKQYPEYLLEPENTNRYSDAFRKSDELMRVRHVARRDGLLEIEKRTHIALAMRQEIPVGLELQRSIELYEAETKTMLNDLDDVKRKYEQTQIQAHLKYMKRFESQMKHDDFVENARRTFLCTQMYRKKPKLPNPRVPDNTDNEKLNEVLLGMISRGEYLNYIRSSTNLRIMNGEIGAYNNAYLKDMIPVLEQRLKSQQTNRVRFINNSTIEDFIDKHSAFEKFDEEHYADIIDTFQNMLETIIHVHTDDVIVFAKWIQTEGIKSRTTDNGKFPTFSFVANAPKSLKEICYLIRLMFLDDTEHEGANTAAYIKLFAKYIETMLTSVDFATFLKEPDGVDWSHAGDSDSDTGGGRAPKSGHGVKGSLHEKKMNELAEDNARLKTSQRKQAAERRLHLERMIKGSGKKLAKNVNGSDKPSAVYDGKRKPKQGGHV